MGILGAADLAAMIADLAAAGATVTVTIGAHSVEGLEDHEAGELLGAEMPGVISGDEVVNVRTGSLPGLTSGSAVTVEGVAYVVRALDPYGDGAMTRVILRKVPSA